MPINNRFRMIEKQNLAASGGSVDVDCEGYDGLSIIIYGTNGDGFALLASHDGTNFADMYPASRGITLPVIVNGYLYWPVTDPLPKKLRLLNIGANPMTRVQFGLRKNS